MEGNKKATIDIVAFFESVFAKSNLLSWLTASFGARQAGNFICALD